MNHCQKQFESYRSPVQGSNIIPPPKWSVFDQASYTLKRFKQGYYWLYLLGRSPQLNKHDRNFQLLKKLPKTKLYGKDCQHLEDWHTQICNSYLKIDKLLSENDHKSCELMIKNFNFIKYTLKLDVFEDLLLHIEHENQSPQRHQQEKKDLRDFKQIGINFQPPDEPYIPRQRQHQLKPNQYQHEEKQAHNKFKVYDDEDLYEQYQNRPDEECHRDADDIKHFDVLKLKQMPLYDREYSEADDERQVWADYSENEADISNEQIKQQVENTMESERMNEFPLQYEAEQYLIDFKYEIPDYDLKLQSFTDFFNNYKMNIFELTGSMPEIYNEQQEMSQVEQKKDNNKSTQPSFFVSVHSLNEQDISGAENDHAEKSFCVQQLVECLKKLDQAESEQGGSQADSEHA